MSKGATPVHCGTRIPSARTCFVALKPVGELHAPPPQPLADLAAAHKSHPRAAVRSDARSAARPFGDWNQFRPKRLGHPR
jgi:hypothetical protein